MTHEIITKIMEAEAEAAELVSEAIILTREIIAEGQKQRDDILNKAREEGEKGAGEILKKAEEDMALQTKSILEDAKNDARTLREKARPKIDGAIVKVIERIVADGSS